MNKKKAFFKKETLERKAISLFVVLILGLFVISGCEKTVGRNIGPAPEGSYGSSQGNNKNTGIISPSPEPCNMVWFDNTQTITRIEPYKVLNDPCTLNGSGFRIYIGDQMVRASCLNINQCQNSAYLAQFVPPGMTGECKNLNQLSAICEEI